MIEPRDIKKMVRTVLRRDRGLRDSRIMHPTREWFIGLIVMIVLVIAGGAYSTVSYVTYDTTEYTTEEVAETLTMYKGAQVESAIAAYTIKKDIHLNLVNSTPVYIPPVQEVASSTPEIITGTSSDASSTPAVESIIKETPVVETPTPVI